jgi:hypothetical protein
MPQQSLLLAFLILVAAVNAFTTTSNPSSRALSSTARKSVALFSDKKKKGGLDGKMRNKLVSESIAPWRTIRLFFYGGRYRLLSPMLKMQVLDSLIKGLILNHDYSPWIWCFRRWSYQYFRSYSWE